jgi:hypothetical protein
MPLEKYMGKKKVSDYSEFLVTRNKDSHYYGLTWEIWDIEFGLNWIFS